MRNFLLPATFALTLALIAGLATAQSTQALKNPVDGKTYVGDFRTYEPTQRAPRTGRVYLEGITLLTAQNDLEGRTTAQALAAYIKRAQEAATPVLSSQPKAGRVLAQFNCQSMGCQVKLASQGEFSQATLQAVFDVLTALPRLETKGAASFQAEFSVAAP